MTIHNVEIISRGEIVMCESHEDTKYKYFTKGIFSVRFTIKRFGEIDCRVDIPAGFLTDGSTGGPDYGISWLFHDYLYATHKVVNTWSGRQIPCTREEADALMTAILQYEDGVFAYLYGRSVAFLTYWNIGWLFSKAWISSGTCGAEFVE